MCAYWLFKSEPSVFSITDLQKSPKKTTCWNGVRNYQARNFFRDAVRKGDLVFFYHSNTDPNAIVGLCEVVKSGYGDYTALDPDSEYYDPKSTKENPLWYMVDIRFKEAFAKPLTLDQLRHIPGLENFRLLQRGNRLSVLPVTETEAHLLLAQAKANT
jgi:predicted RNA-binding protein with PUA-like domain